MTQQDDAVTPREPTDTRAVPRAVVRLLRSGALDEAKTRRMIEIHGETAREAAGAIKAEPIKAEPIKA
jgi:hypothetical protein